MTLTYGMTVVITLVSIGHIFSFLLLIFLYMTSSKSLGFIQKLFSSSFSVKIYPLTYDSIQRELRGRLKS